MPHHPRAPALLLGLLALAACDRPAPQLPLGRVAGGQPFADVDAAIVVSDLGGDTPVLAVVDERGAPRWVKPLSRDEFKELYSSPPLAVSADLVLLTGNGVHAHERSTGALRWHRPGQRDEQQQGVIVADGLLLYPSYERLDVLDPASGATLWSVDAPERVHVSYLANSHVARITDIRRWIRGDGSESPDTLSRERVEVVHGPTGELVWSEEIVSHCVVGTDVLAVIRDGSIVALDLASTPVAARTVAPAGLLPRPQHWQIAECTRRDDTWWLQQEVSGDASLFHAIPRTNGSVRQVGLCGVVSATGRVALARGHGDQTDLKAYDLDRNQLLWGQNLKIHKPQYTSVQTVGDLVFLTTEYEREKVQHVLAFDPDADEITGAVALRAVDAFQAHAGPHWLFSSDYSPRGNAALTVLGHRDLRPQLPPPTGVDIVDTLAEARAGQQRPGTDLVFTPAWDPAWVTTTDEDEDGPCRHPRLGDAPDVR